MNPRAEQFRRAGLPLAVEFGKRYPTVGFDIHEGRVAELLAQLHLIAGLVEAGPEQLGQVILVEARSRLPSGSVSLTVTLMILAVSSGVLSLSSLATGGSFTGEIVSVAAAVSQAAIDQGIARRQSKPAQQDSP